MSFVGVSLAWDRFWVLVEAIPGFVKLGESIFSALMAVFFVSDEADRYFVSSPLEWSFEIVIGEDILKQGFGDD